MRYMNMLFILILLASYVFVSPAAAETRYVVDELLITLRQGKSTQHKILKSLITGTPLEVLGEDDGSYIKVRTADGIEGYVLRQYISPNIPQKQRIEELETIKASLQNKISTLEEANNHLETQLKTVQEEYNQKSADINSRFAGMEQNLEQALYNEQTMAEKYDTLLAQSENVIEVVAERDQLLQNNIKLEANVTELLRINEKLSDSRMIKWFLAGGGVFLFGWIIGKSSRKKRSRL